MADPISEDVLRREIEERVRALSALKHRPRPFLPGVTPIPYSGRVFDEAEVVSLVESSLDFWLTATRAREELGWKPTIALEEGLAEVVEWVEANWSEMRQEPLAYVHRP